MRVQGLPPEGSPPRRGGRSSCARGCARRGASVLEFAVVAPVVFLLMIGFIVTGYGVFRYQEVSFLAREATRYASTHGGQYYLDGRAAATGVPAVFTDADITDYVKTRCAGLDTSCLTVSLSYSAPSSITPKNLPTYVDTNPALVPPGQSAFQNYVTVTVSYKWTPEAVLSGPITLTSTSTVAVSY